MPISPQESSPPNLFTALLGQDHLQPAAQQPAINNPSPLNSSRLVKYFDFLVSQKDYHGVLILSLQLLDTGARGRYVRAAIESAYLLGDIELSLNICRHLRSTNPKDTNLIINESKCLELMGRPREAIDLLLGIDYDMAPLNSRLGLKVDTCHLLSEIYALMGDYERYSFFLNKNYLYKGKDPALFSAKAILSCDSILVQSNVGLGDSIQNFRFIRHLEERGVRVFWQVSQKLHSLFLQSGTKSHLFEDSSGLAQKPRYSVHVRYLRPILEFSPVNPIGDKKYLFANRDRKRHWKAQLQCKNKMLIGINWAGDQDCLGTKMNLMHRSLRLDAFFPISQLTGIKLISLQKGEPAEQLSVCAFRDKFVDCQERISKEWDFCENAAIISCCDLVITNDTVVAHLAASLGRPTWLLLKKVPSWRWGLSGSTTFMYSSMRIFRQACEGDWGRVMRDVAMELSKSLYHHP